MFDQTWTWAGAYRKTDKSLGLRASHVRVTLRERLADATLWLVDQVYDVDEIAARLHYQLVVVHPWPNGNGRWSRLMADAFLHAEQRPRFSWGAATLDRTTQARERYLTALRLADRGNLQPLLSFVRQ